MTTYTESTATFSTCHRHRYSLVRAWEDGGGNGTVMFIGLNPSTADASKDDPTIRRCVNFAKAWGYDRLVMTNLFSFRTPSPVELFSSAVPYEKENDKQLLKEDNKANLVVASWGNYGNYLKRDRDVLSLLADKSLHVLRITGSGMPAHPLYIPRDYTPVLWDLSGANHGS